MKKKNWVVGLGLLLMIAVVSVAAPAGQLSDGPEAPEVEKTVPVPQAQEFLARVEAAADRDAGNRMEWKLFGKMRAEVAKAIAPAKIDAGVLFLYAGGAPVQSDTQARRFEIVYTTEMLGGRSSQGREAGDPPRPFQLVVRLSGTLITRGDCSDLKTCQVEDATYSSASIVQPSLAAAGAAVPGGVSSAGGG